MHLLALGVRFMIDGERTGGAFSLVEHPLPPRALGAPLHTHHHEDEYSYVLAGRFGVQLGGDTLEAGPGDLVFKPRGVARYQLDRSYVSGRRLIPLLSREDAVLNYWPFCLHDS